MCLCLLSVTSPSRCSRLAEGRYHLRRSRCLRDPPAPQRMPASRSRRLDHGLPCRTAVSSIQTIRPRASFLILSTDSSRAIAVGRQSLKRALRRTPDTLHEKTKRSIRESRGCMPCEKAAGHFYPHLQYQSPIHRLPVEPIRDLEQF